MSNGSKNDLDKNLRANNCAMQTEQMAANFVKKIEQNIYFLEFMIV